MTTVYKYRIYCITENTWSYIWSETLPTTCPNDTNHEVNPESISDIDSVTTVQQPSINRYTIFCETESLDKICWGTDPPTKCPTNTDHTVNLSSIEKFGRIKNPNSSIPVSIITSHINCYFNRLWFGHIITSSIYK